MRIRCSSYSGDLPVVIQIRKLILEKYYDLFLAVIVHGSCATDEVIKYSDFDGLLIIRDKFQKSRKLRRFLIESMKIIYMFDPLQHHGWFIMTENDLRNYPQTYFPFELFQFSRSIYPNSGFEIEVKISGKTNYKTPFYEMSDSIMNKINNKFNPKNIYQMKSVLSQILLLPTLYLQAKENRGVYKRDSFKLASKDFSIKEWEVISRVTEIRKYWDIDLKFPHYQLLLIQNKFIRRIITRYLKFALTGKQIENYNFILSDISKLIEAMKKKLTD